MKERVAIPNKNRLPSADKRQLLRSTHCVWQTECVKERLAAGGGRERCIACDIEQIQLVAVVSVFPSFCSSLFSSIPFWWHVFSVCWENAAAFRRKCSKFTGSLLSFKYWSGVYTVQIFVVRLCVPSFVRVSLMRFSSHSNGIQRPLILYRLKMQTNFVRDAMSGTHEAQPLNRVRLLVWNCGPSACDCIEHRFSIFLGQFTVCVRAALLASFTHTKN